MATTFVAARLWPFILISAVIVGLWLQRYLSSSKIWFFQTASSAVLVGAARFWYYVVPFLALAFLLFGMSSATGEDPHSMVPVYWIFAGWGFIILGLVAGFLQPTWLSPPWLRRLKREYRDVIPHLVEDAVGMDKYMLAKRLETWESLEQWVAEVQRKHGLEEQ
jgi:hypothetical protein